MRRSGTPKRGKATSDNRKQTAPPLAAAELGRVTAGYQLWLVRQPLSPNTRRTYLGRVRQYCAYLRASGNDYGNPLSDLHARDYAIRDFKSHLKKSCKAKPASVNLLKAKDEQPSLAALEALVDARLPLIELPDLLMEVDGWTGFSRHLEHAGGAEPRTPDLLVHCHASILAQACNFGLTRMAQLADLSYRQLAWCLREENASTSDREHRQPPLPSSIGPSLGWRHALLLRWTTFSGSGPFADCDRDPALLRLWHWTDILYVDLGSVLAVW